MHSLYVQQHGWLWEDRDIRRQRQSGYGKHQARVLWAAAGPGERWLWKGTVVPNIQQEMRKHVTFSHFCLKHFLPHFFRFFKLEKLLELERAKYLPWKFWRRYLFLFFSGFILRKRTYVNRKWERYNHFDNTHAANTPTLHPRRLQRMFLMLQDQFLEFFFLQALDYNISKTKSCAHCFPLLHLQISSFVEPPVKKL